MCVCVCVSSKLEGRPQSLSGLENKEKGKRERERETSSPYSAGEERERVRERESGRHRGYKCSVLYSDRPGGRQRKAGDRKKEGARDGGFRVVTPLAARSEHQKRERERERESHLKEDSKWFVTASCVLCMVVW